MNYVELRRKYKNLPDADWIASRFGIDTNRSIFEINRDVVEKLENFADALEQVLTVKESYRSFMEHKFISRSDLEKLYVVYKNFISCVCKFNSFVFSGDVEKNVNWLVEVKEVLEEAQSQIEDTFSTLSKKWKEEKALES